MDRIRLFNSGRALSYNAPTRDCGGVYMMSDYDSGRSVIEEFETKLEEMEIERNSYEQLYNELV